MNKRHIIAFRVLSGTIIFVLLMPTTLFYIAGLFGWGMFIIASIFTVSKRIVNEGWGIVTLELFSSLAGMTLFIIVAGCSLLSLWMFVFYIFDGKTIKEIPLFIWAGLCTGTVATFVYLNPTNMNTNDVRVQILFGMGPLIVSFVLCTWLIFKEFVLDKRIKIDNSINNNTSL